ncbi:MAG TPA: hypothetical protein VKK31_04380, partial [Thermoanaerobaculia bacterium]|nr:hypothetical protein [Thermoanaerobaculia bacterium]
KGHVEARIISRIQGLHPGDVVNAVAARADEIPNLLDPDSAGIDLLGSEPRLKAALEDHENQGMEKREVLAVERTIDEEAAVEAIRRSRHRPL